MITPHTRRPRRIYLHTFGCRANQYDTERMRQLLELRGCETVDDPGLADAVVVNSCTVTGNADSELRRYVRRVGRRGDGALPVVVAGCATAVAAESIRGLDGVSAVVPGQDPEAVANSLGVFPRTAAEMAPATLDRAERGTRAWLKVQDGCDLNCSYCIIRVARGRSRSRSPDEIVAEAQRLAEHHPEISLTGIHIGLYGKDSKPRVTLAALVETLLERVPDVRFRIGSLECNQLDDAIIDLMADSDGRLAPHLHVPLQSGSDAVLRGMRRAYRAERYRARVERLAERIVPLGLGTDVIVGFPGETDGDHRRTVELIESLPFTYVHVFPYSDRSGTDAEDLPDRLPERVKTERSREIRALVGDKARAHRRARLGTLARVVLEGDADEVAVTGDYLKMPALDSLRALGRRLRTARIESDGNGGLVAAGEG
ncbi:MAG: MiaB/RimO family radical SAM methylthiotransferase [Gemmatimonadetes bacterium]|uniref:MiaB/RimO family radical SAM methylthiotransferase n=1 Tax=Candidatus Kutchimonas denitrificans TaxID=3056748 RepID=A0AAE5CAF9_9BACT|nr:MiaB/RimO family radical SAM methylthiotransferase [Gemmatimonadota bacterium]NIR74567.1 MiaB/RimO family radical SAM methylthiotransferase [Candidatus Kutchimonas denitrificans]NIS02757.1 MiaB/RimO family radical SAM methylthiotransferase [Gemmatimonadota bacterium]NIT68918.1 MiaB/RimO family radical SAM methylthiotransferase [Gemmatimonadota bacterium]NIU52223.1 MiaB/RimO family radical SAM methylthiotransferase [Gemmatimonadota bacterium]